MFFTVRGAEYRLNAGKWERVRFPCYLASLWNPWMTSEEGETALLKHLSPGSEREAAIKWWEFIELVLAVLKKHPCQICLPRTNSRWWLFPLMSKDGWDLVISQPPLTVFRQQQQS